MNEPLAPLSLSRRDFERLSALVEAQCGIRMPPAKKTLLESRLGKRVRELGMAGFSEYCDHVLSGRASEELVDLLDRVTTNKTDFFREPQHFDLLVQTALPELATRHGAGTARELRAWSAGCSTGEEPYTLAMVLAEALPEPGFQILATDLSTRVLQHAEDAVYPDALVAPVPLPLRRKYLLRSRADPDQVRVGKGLRDRVRFRRLNLLDEAYALPHRMDVIFCRNVFIYFERRTQEAILRRFARSLVPGGFLFIGHAETITGLHLPFDAVGPTAYQLREGQA